MNTPFYIRNYDRHDQVLVIDPAKGKQKMVSRDEAQTQGIGKGFGAFVAEGGHVLGIHASPDGPVLFCDEHSVVARFGVTSAKVTRDATTGILSYVVIEDGAVCFGTQYQERDGVGTNPYDTEPEDVDLFRMIASGLKKQQFFANYTRT